VQQVEELIFYGADINQQNAGGNTALHVCAANSQVCLCVCVYLYELGSFLMSSEMFLKYLK